MTIHCWRLKPVKFLFFTFWLDEFYDVEVEK